MNFLKKHNIIFAAGVVTTMAAKSVLKSKKVRELAVKTVAAGMKLQQDAAYELETIREEAADLVEEQYQKDNTVDFSDEI